MIGYVRQGDYPTIVEKLNSQIDSQHLSKNEHLKFIGHSAASPKIMLEAIYESQHISPVTSDLLTITHLLLHFLQVDADSWMEERLLDNYL